MARAAPCILACKPSAPSSQHALPLSPGLASRLVPIDSPTIPTLNPPRRLKVDRGAAGEAGRRGGDHRQVRAGRGHRLLRGADRHMVRQHVAQGARRGRRAAGRGRGRWVGVLMTVSMASTASRGRRAAFTRAREACSQRGARGSAADMPLLAGKEELARVKWHVRFASRARGTDRAGRRRASLRWGRAARRCAGCPARTCAPRSPTPRARGLRSMRTSAWSRSATWCDPL